MTDLEAKRDSWMPFFGLLAPVALTALLTVTLSASADLIGSELTREIQANGRVALCRIPFGGSAEQKQCYQVSELTPLEIPVEKGKKEKFTQLRVEEFAFERADSESAPTEFVINLHWQGQGAGLLSISGPEGSMRVFGSFTRISKQGTNSIKIKIEDFLEGELSQQFSRGTLFGESDPVRLNVLTQIWLEEKIAPMLEKYLESRIPEAALPAIAPP